MKCPPASPLWAHCWQLFTGFIQAPPKRKADWQPDNRQRKNVLVPSKAWPFRNWYTECIIPGSKRSWVFTSPGTLSEIRVERCLLVSPKSSSCLESLGVSHRRILEWISIYCPLVVPKSQAPLDDFWVQKNPADSAGMSSVLPQRPSQEAANIKTYLSLG